MTTRDVERIRFVTRHFNELQGLRGLVPPGLLFMSQGLLFASHGRHWPWVYLVVITILLGCLAWYPRSGPYYRRTFGEVEQRQAGLGVGGSSLPVYRPAGLGPLAAGTRSLDPKLLRWLISAAAAYALLLLLRAILPAATLLTDGPRVDPWAHRPDPLFTQTMYYTFGALYLGMWFVKRERRLSQMHYLVIGLLLLSLAVLGTFLGLILPELRNLGIESLPRFFLPLLTTSGWAQVLCGATMVLAGLLDHLQLVRVLKPLREEVA